MYMYMYIYTHIYKKPYLHPSISTALMRPRRPKQYCLQLVIDIYIPVTGFTDKLHSVSYVMLKLTVLSSSDW